MANSQVRIFNIGAQEVYYPLREIGFTLAKLCGKEIIGFKVALGIGYIEELSLRQNSIFPNTIFLEPYFEDFTKDNSELSQVLQRIGSKSSNQSHIVQLAKDSSSFISQVITFVDYVFKIPEACASIYTLINDESFQKSLETLNLQLYFYTFQGLVGSLKQNKYIHPIVLNILISDTDDSVYNLYHKNYIVTSPENLNTSEEFIDIQVDDLGNLEKLARILLEKLPNLSTLSDHDQEVLKTLIKKIKSSNLAGFTYESLLSN